MFYTFLFIVGWFTASNEALASVKVDVITSQELYSLFWSICLMNNKSGLICMRKTHVDRIFTNLIAPL